MLSVELADLATVGYNAHVSQVSFFEARQSTELIGISAVDIREIVGQEL